MNETEKKIIEVVSNHFLAEGVGKLTIQKVAELSNISRQSINQYYKHLKPYILGIKPVSEIMMMANLDSSNVLTKAQNLISKLQLQLEGIEAAHQKELLAVEASYITSLMNGDISIHNLQVVNSTLEKQSLHSDSLLQKISHLQGELAAKAASQIAQNFQGKAGNIEKQIIPLDYEKVYKKFIEDGDVDQLEAGKQALLDQAVKQIKKLSGSKLITVVLFVNRFLTKFESFIFNYVNSVNGYYVFLSVPIFTSVEMSIFIRKLDGLFPIDVFIPFCQSEPVKVAQRKFLFRGVPEYEFNAADKMSFPNINQGFQRISYFLISSDKP